MELTITDVERELQQLYGSGGTRQGSQRVSDVTMLGSGYEADAFAFSIHEEGDSAAEDLVLRIYAGAGASEKAAWEFGAMSRLRQAGYPVPRVLRFQDDGSPFGRAFIIMERIHGMAMEWSPPEERQEELQALVCRLMVQLHALEGSGILPGHPLAGSPDPYACVDHELTFLSTLLGRLEGREPPSLRGVLDWLGARRSEVPCDRPSVVHGDFHRNNILLRADGAAFVIDWSNVRLGDYRSELAWSRLLTGADSLPDGGASELRRYERLAGREVCGIEVFEVMACTRLLSSVLVSLHAGAAREGMRPESEALMRQKLDFMLSVAALLQRRTGLRMPDLEAALSTHLA